MIINIGKETIALTHWLKEGDFWSSRHVVKNGHRAYDIFFVGTLYTCRFFNEFETFNYHFNMGWLEKCNSLEEYQEVIDNFVIKACKIRAFL